MNKGQDRGRLDWLVELAGAAAPAAAMLFAAEELGPELGWSVPALAAASGGGTFVLAFLALRALPPEPRHLALPEFAAAAVVDDELLLDQIYAGDALDVLVLDQPWVEAFPDGLAELLLDDPLPEPASDSRVVQLFANGRMPTAGQLASRIDRHLADGGRAAPEGDASDALSEALAELRRSLRNG
jgi:hypothetical protein